MVDPYFDGETLKWEMMQVYLLFFFLKNEYFLMCFHVQVDKFGFLINNLCFEVAQMQVP